MSDIHTPNDAPLTGPYYTKGAPFPDMTGATQLTAGTNVTITTTDGVDYINAEFSQTPTPHFAVENIAAVPSATVVPVQDTCFVVSNNGIVPSSVVINLTAPAPSFELLFESIGDQLCVISDSNGRTFGTAGATSIELAQSGSTARLVLADAQSRYIVG